MAVFSVAFTLGSLILLGVLLVSAVVALVKIGRFLSPGAARARAPAVAARPDDREELAVRRYRQLLELGLDPVTAAGATLADIDVPALGSLLEHGWPPDRALRVLDPDD